MIALADRRCAHCGASCVAEGDVCPECGQPREAAAPAEAEDFFIDQELPGGHRVMELIGTGGMGRVYRAEQQMLGRTVAVKVIHPHLSRDEVIEARFFTEAKAASQLNHPNSVNIIDFGTFRGRPYMVMEFLRGRALSTVQDEEGLLGLLRIGDVMGQTLAALAEAHHLGIVHRDLKPENILLQSLRSGGDFVKVVDFGLAILGRQAQSARLTFPGMVCGSPHYMAPEHIRGEEVDGRADLYSCGVILYELLTGQPPFDGDTPHVVLAQQLNEAPADPRKVAPQRELPDALVDVVLRALAKPVTERFQSALELSEALRCALETAAVPQGASSGFRVRCPQCRHLLRRGQKFCGQCGARIRRSSAPPVQARMFATSLPSVRAQGRDQVVTEPGGRRDVLGWLAERHAAAGRRVVAASLVGPSGVGKTRVLATFAQRVERAGARVARVGPDPWWARVGYHALREAVCALAELPPEGGDPDRWSSAPAEAVAGLQELFGVRLDGISDQLGSWSKMPPVHLSRSERRPRAAAALRWALERAAEESASSAPVVLIDDFHAVDGASQNAFFDVAADPGGSAGLLVMAREDDGGDDSVATDGRRRLEGLSEEAAANLLERGRASVPAGVAGADGARPRRLLPLYVEQLIRFASEQGDDPPTGLSDLVAVRVERLPPARRRVVQALCVLGDGVPEEYVVALASEATSTQFEAPARSFKVLEAAGMIVRSEGLVWISHPLIRDVVLWGTPAEVRRHLHRRARSPKLADVLAIPLEAQASHAIDAEDAFEALHLVDQVAVQAAERGDLDGCIDVLRRGLALARMEMTRGGLTDPIGAQLHFSVKLADALALRGELLQADGVIREALDLGGPRAGARPRLLASQAHVAHLRGRDELAHALVEQARAAAHELGRSGQLEALDRLERAWAAGG